jgi:hypothetical protein
MAGSWDDQHVTISPLKQGVFSMSQGDTHISPEQWRRLTGQRTRKYRNEPTTVNGLRFDSKREVQRAQELMLMAQAGLITDLVLDKRELRYALIVNGQQIGTYTPDARYREHGQLVVEDVKSTPTKTRAYQRTKKLMLVLYGIVIREII